MGKGDRAELTQALIPPADVQETLVVSGSFNRTVRAAEGGPPLFFFKQKLSVKICRDLYAGGEACGEPLLRVRSAGGWGLLWGGCPIALEAGPKREPIATLVPDSRWRNRRRFSYGGRDFLWRHECSWSCTERFVLEELQGGAAVSLVAEYAVGGWSGRGTLTLRRQEPGSALPREVVLATALTMAALEQIRNGSGSFPS